MAKLAKPVGAGKKAVNDPKDVKIVKDALQKHTDALGVKPIRGGPAVDQALITAIGAFEQKVLKQRVTSLVLPNSKALKMMQKSERDIQKILPATPEMIKAVEAEMEKNKQKMLKALRTGILKEAQTCYLVSEQYYMDALQNRKDFWCVPVMEKTSGAKLPGMGKLKAAQKAVGNLETAITNGKFQAIQKAIPAAEKALNDLSPAVADYWNKLNNSSSNWVTTLTWTKTAGFVALGVVTAGYGNAALATTIANGVARGAVVGATSGAFGGGVEAVLNTIGQKYTPGKMSYEQFLVMPVKGAVTGFFVGGFNGFATPKIAKRLGEQALKDGPKLFASDILQTAIRGGTGGATKIAWSWYTLHGLAEIGKMEARIIANLSPSASKQDIADTVARELYKSKSYHQFIKAEYEKLAKEEQKKGKK